MTTANRMHSGNREVVLDGRGKIVLRDSDHITTGGEGAVYKKGDTAIKIYKDPQKMKRDGMADKVRALVVLAHPYIVSPRGVVLDGRGSPIGLYMPYVEGEPFPRVFTEDFRTRTRFGDKDANVLTERMQEVVKFAHCHQAIIADGNELNWLLVMSGNGAEPRIIDVDSWSIGRWPPKVIMPSIQDRHSTKVDELTDWFAWGIVSFQVYTGIHPYKGTLDGYGRYDLEKRMRDNASIFSSGIKLNDAVRDFNRIPSGLLGWYIDTFQNGMRQVPPSPFDTSITAQRGVVATRTVVSSAGTLKYTKLYDGKSPAVRVFHCGIVLLESKELFDLSRKRVVGHVNSLDCEIVEQENHWLVASRNGDKLEFYAINKISLTKNDIIFHVSGERILNYQNRLFLVTNQGLTEVQLKVLGRPILASGNTWGAMTNSTRWFDGVGVMDAMGAMFVIAPFGDDSVAQIRVRELDGLRTIFAKAGNRFVSLIVADKNGAYHKIELTFSRDYRSYQFWQDDAENPELNMAILPRGVCAIVKDDGEMNIFVPTSGTLNKIQDKGITTTMILANWENTVAYIRNGEVWTMRM